MPTMQNLAATSTYALRAFLNPADAAVVPKLLRMRYDTMRFFRFNGAERSRLLEYINIYYRLHVANFPELKSLAVLKSLWSM